MDWCNKRVGVCLLLLLLLVACGDTERPTPASYEPPTARPTPANYADVPDAATIGPVSRPTLSSPTPIASQNSPASQLTELSPTAITGDDQETTDDEGVGGPGDRLLDGADPTTLAKLLGSSGSGYQTGGGVLPLTPGAKRNGQPSRPAPTPTLNTNPTAVRIESLRTTQVSFLVAYRQAAVKAVEGSRTARLVFASANVLKADRTVWSFLFVAPEGPRMWRVIYDSEGSKLALQEVAPSMLNDVKLIDMSKVLDSPALIEQAGNSGLNVGLPVDIVNFQVEGLSKQPCFIFTNVAQGKQVAINAYTGQVLRNDFTV